MARTQLKSRVQTKLKSRVGLCLDTAHRFLSIAEQHGVSRHCWDDRLELMIRNQFVSRITIVIWKGSTPVAGARLSFDWNEHDVLCFSYGDDVDMTGIPDGETFRSIQDGLNAVKAYVDGVMRQGKATRAQAWYSFDTAAKEKYGLAEIRRILKLERTEDQLKQERREWQTITKVEATGKSTSHVLSDAAEMMLSAWVK